MFISDWESGARRPTHAYGMLFLSVCLLTTSGLIWGFFTYNASKQRPKLKLFNITELNTKVDKFNTETAACMSLEQLQEAVHLSALPTPPEWHSANLSSRVVLLTTMNLKGIQSLFSTFIHGLETARGGDASKHLVLVANGLDAYIHCTNLTKMHSHRCVLDRMCPPPRQSTSNQSLAHSPFHTANYGTRLYFLSLMQKVRWSLEIVTILNCSVLWTDMDQYFYQNPLLFLFDRLPLNSDAVLLSEYWNSANAHKGDFCRLDSLGLSYLGKGNCSDRDRACANVTCAKDFQPSFKPGRENLVRCCDGPINGGQFLINPTPGGKIFVSMWFAIVFKNYVVEERMWNGSALLDQVLLVDALNAKEQDIYAWNHSLNNYRVIRKIHRNNVETRALRASHQRWTLQYGKCGLMAPNLEYQSYSNHTHPHVCIMPKKQRDRRVSYHCAAGSHRDKEQCMKNALSMTYDEERYFKEMNEISHLIYPKDKKIQRTVFPDWDDLSKM